MITQEMCRAQRQVPSPCRSSTTNNTGTSESELNPLGIPSPFLRLPPELLLHIFKGTVPPLYQHDPSLVQGPRNPWLAALRTRKALVLTCKTFFAPATEVLYEDIVFRRMGQIPALARTLGASPPPTKYGPRLDFGALVKRIRMDGCVIWAPCADVVREDLRLILHRCVGLRSFSFHPHPQFPCANDPAGLGDWDMFNPVWLVTANDNIASIGGLLRHRFSTSLRTFDLAMTLDAILLEHLHWFLSAAPHLAVLKLGPVLPDDYHSTLAALPVLTLPSLRELQIHATHPPFQSHVAQRWALPRLSALTLLACAAVPEALLAAHGAALTYLHVRHGLAFVWDVSQFAPLARLPALCPVLEHLVVPTWHRAPLPVHSPTLRWLDVWGHHPPPAVLRAGFYQLARECELPRFERMRILGTMPRAGWGAALSVDWPRVCHPSLAGNADTAGAGFERVYDFPGARVVQTAWGVIHDFCQDDLTFSHGDGVERRDNSGEYMYEGEGEDDGTSVVSDETESFQASFEEEEEDDDLADFFGVPMVEPLGRDGMLERFRESQDRYFLFDDD
ncbi:hypothetical protein GSI_05109 [Ganoderma sinense ZZ0214-1]|uniref:F-box domain-containing protein n=1 Tax=Ganoderma sinense ZZ0214-1 TaxID=1077348 RepID=A0A2G8SGW3_9APHY|nr:hypothetical protein GSI_05109 [Ganoderma sinense ZZ0214-1]